ncbi:MAG: hypothetical protein ACI9ON_000207 [Limisphaerales bacterium]|jgi:hypothetical protein
MNKQTNIQTPIQTLGEFELEQASGGIVPIAVVLAVYTFVAPILAAGVAVGIGEAVENRQ